jgi:hypothetical protein
VGSLRIVGGVAGLIIGIGTVVWLGIVVKAGWVAIAFWAFVLGAIGARIGSLALLPIWQHKLLIQVVPVFGAMGGLFLGVYLVHGIPAKGDFGLPVYACSAALASRGWCCRW